MAATDGVVKLADLLWRGEASIADHHPFSPTGRLEEVADRTAFVPSFANVTALATDDGLVLIDTGSIFLAADVHRQLRSWDRTPLHTAVYSHGHIDHVFGVPIFEEEARRERWPAPRVLAHRALPNRFDRYILTAGYNAIINQRQFQAPGLEWPTEYRYPDETYEEHHRFTVGGTAFELHHALGETDDHTWTYIPERKILCCGDLFIWASPNAGNPQKVQRFPKEWASALREMAGCGAELMLAGHGLPVVGAARIRQALTETAELLESLVSQTLDMMNSGARLDEILHTVAVPAHLSQRPYLQPVYDEPEFIVRNIWRLYGGWYDGNPANLKPASERALAQEIAALAGGARRLASRSQALATAGGADNLRLAGHLAEWAALAQPEDIEVQGARAEVFACRVETERSTMAKGLFAWAANESRRRSEPPTPDG